MMALVLVMGIPGSGKTTLCKKLEERFGANALHISFDEIFGYCRITGEQEQCSLLGYYGSNANQSSAREERKFCELMIRDSLNMMKTEGKFSLPPYESILWNITDSFIIIDDIFYLKSMRRPFERMARAHSLCYIIVLMDTSLEIALKRNSGRPPKVCISETTIRRIYEEMELPSEEAENFIRFSVNGKVEDLVHQIENIRSKLKLKQLGEKSVHPTCNPMGDSICLWRDLERDLRKCIGELVSKEKSQDLARSLGIAKKEIIKDFRNNDCKNWGEIDLKSLLQSKLSNKNINL